MKKRLYRSSEHRLIAGVVAGIAEYFDHDPTLWRLGVILGFLFTGLMPGLLLYLVAWIIVPLNTAPKVHDVDYTDHGTHG
jgi:phage shock protein C